MFKITNISNNPLPLTNGRIAPGETESVKAVGERERSYEKRGWLRVIEVQKESKPVPPPAPPKQMANNQEADKKS